MVAYVCSLSSTAARRQSAGAIRDRQRDRVRRLRSPAHAQRVLAARRRVARQGAHRQRQGDGPDGDRHHRPRRALRSGRFLRDRARREDQPDPRLRDVHGAALAPRSRGPDRPRSQPPHPAGAQRHRLSQPHQAGQHGAPRGLLLQAAHRSRAARGARRGSDLPLRVPRRRAAPGDPARRHGRRRDGRACSTRRSSAPTTTSSSSRTTASPRRTTVRAGLVEIARRTGLPLVATNDSHYIKPEDAEAHDILLCLQTGARREEEKRFRFSGPEYYLASTQQMRERFAAYGEAVANTVAIADRCHVEIPLGAATCCRRTRRSPRASTPTRICASSARRVCASATADAVDRRGARAAATWSSTSSARRDSRRTS